jgi:AcrR family transcriptional regulator
MPEDTPQTEPVRRPSKTERDAVRRAQIVDAAQACVVGQGFHAASMAQIAAQARMSVGQIYRYFPSKEAIVRAIVERIVNRRVQAMPGWNPADMATRLGHRRLYEGAEDARDQVLLMEVAAEATRNPEVAELMREADQRLHAHAEAAVRRDNPGLSATDAATHVELVAVLFEGTAFRTGTAHAVDAARLTRLYRAMLESLFPAERFAAKKKPPSGKATSARAKAKAKARAAPTRA